jgi:hypothetical protein
LKARLKDIPTAIVQGPVSRPEWLVELEGVAITGNDEASLPRF